MNALTGKSEHSPAFPADDETLVRHLAALFGSLMHEKEGVTTKAVLENYLDVLSDTPEWAVGDACEQYRRGYKGNGRFVPTAAELARTARELVAVREKVEREQLQRDRERAAIKQQFTDNQAFKDRHSGVTPESRARVAAKLAEAKAITLEHKLEQERVDREKIARERNELMRNLPREMRYDPDKSEYERVRDKYHAEARKALLKTLAGQRRSA